MEHLSLAGQAWLHPARHAQQKQTWGGSWILCSVHSRAQELCRRSKSARSLFTVFKRASQPLGPHHSQRPWCTRAQCCAEPSVCSLHALLVDLVSQQHGDSVRGQG